MIKKISLAQLKLFALLLVLFFVSASFLIFSPMILNLAQNKISSSSITAYNYTDNIESTLKTEIIDTGVSAPTVSSDAFLVMDFDSGEILYQKNMNKRLSPASTTKLVTAMVAVEYFQPESILTVPPQALVGGSSMDLQLNERLTFRSLLYGMLLNSGNDAAFTIAANYPGGIANFVVKMNEKAATLGLNNSHFENPAGFDSSGHFSSAYDLSVIAQEAVKNSTLAKIFATKETEVISFDQTKLHSLKNLNQLLGEKGVLGIKTGYTEKSGENLVGLVERSNRKVLTVVLNSDNRFTETRDLVNWVFSNFVWKEKVTLKTDL